MPSFKQLALALAALAPLALGASLPEGVLEKRQTITNVGPNCGNTATTRSQWCPGFTIATDADLNVPNTGVTRSYTLTITKGPCAPDGSTSKTCTLVNGSTPGPPLIANWGDTLQVTVINSMTDNGTSIHWHGVRQLNSNPNDGANGVTECPIAPGNSKVYTFLATIHGTSWYHSHHSVQEGDGLYGTIQINGPAVANYDTDLGVLPINDWFYQSVWTLNAAYIRTGGVPPSAQNILLNGTMKSISGTGSYFNVPVVAGKTYRLRLLNAAFNHQFVFSIDNHPMTVIAADWVPIQPKTGVTQVTMGPGQRYDILFTANQAASNYWMRVKPGCVLGGVADVFNSQQYQNGQIVPGAILHYSTAPVTNPTSTGYSVTQTCNDDSVTPYWARTVPSSGFSASQLAVSQGTVQRNPGGTLVAWFINNSAQQVPWGNPTLQQVISGQTAFPASENVYSINGVSTTWTYWVIQYASGFGPPVAHPIHLHGHNFYVLGSGTGTFSGGTSGLNFATAPRRDTAMLPAGGWLVVAFLLDNPGAWLMHCHIAWHVSQGFSLQFLERASSIQSSIPAGQFTAMQQNCNVWNAYAPSAPYQEYDSGV